jgi:flagellar hook capping protein FlgD
MFPNRGEFAFGVIVGLSALLLAPWPREVAATETVTVNYNASEGQIDYHVGGGLGGQWADILPDSMISLIKPPAVRISNLWQNSNNLWTRAAHNNTTVVIVVKGAVDARPTADPLDKDFTNHWVDSTPGDSLVRMNEWKDHVHHWVNLAKANRVVNGDTVRVQYDIWNEPDVEWHPNAAYNSPNLFFDVWNTAVDSIRVWDPGAIITGPSFAYAGPGAGSEVSTRSGLTMDIFLQRCYAAGTLPDVLGSHHIGYSDYTAPNSLDGPCRWNLYAQVADLRDQVDTVFTNIPGSGIDANSFEYEINEMLNPDLPNPDYCNIPYTGPVVHVAVTPGVLVRNFALAEQARADNLGLLFACRTVWCDPCSTCIGGPEFYLAHLLDPCAADVHGLFRPRYAWWVYKAYADITGSYVHASTTGSVDAIAGMCANADTSRILIGNYSPGTATDLRVVLKNLNSTNLVVNEAIQVTVKRLLGAPDNVYQAYQGLGPLLISSGRLPVNGDSAVVDISSNQCGPGDAVSIEVARITPGITVARGNFLTVEDAIQATDIGDTVIVVPLDTGTPYKEDDIHLKNGVKVVAQSGSLPIFIGDEDTVFVFPENANAFTSLEGIVIRAGDSTRVLVALRGAGSMRNCTLSDSMGVATTTTGILATGHTGEIRNCTLQMTSHSHTTGQTVVAMDLGDLTGANSTHVVGCSINAKTGYTQTYGIRTSIYADAVIESTFVTSENLGIDLWDNSVVRFCTVDNTYYEGISGGTSARIENCIVTNMLGPWEHGIIGNNIDYCICPQGFSDLAGTGNSTEDPHYCSTGIYTLRADSYGNPDNNASGKQIGAFPVACLFGTLARNVTWNGTHPALSILGDVTVPAGKSLTVGNGGVFKIAVGDNQQAGQNPFKTELSIAGSFTVNALQQAARFTSVATAPSPGNWLGFKFLAGSSVSVDSAIVEYADSAFTFSGTAHGSVKHTRFASNATADVICDGLVNSSGVTLEANQLLTHGPTGIQLKGCFFSAPVTIKSNTISSSGSEGYGIYLFSDANPTPQPTITENTIQGFFLGGGMNIETGSPLITKNSISGCTFGIRVRGGGSVAGTPQIGQEWINNSDNIISGNSTGISCEYTALSAKIRENKINGNTYGVVAKNGATPNLGTCNETGNNHNNCGGVEDSPGHNNLSGNSVYCVWNRNTGSHPPQISALANYFGTCGQICWLGNIDTGNQLCSPPASAPNMEIEILPTEKVFRISKVVPNPTREGVEIQFSLDSDGWVTVGAFDVSGRLVRRISEVARQSGAQAVRWDGKNSEGVSVPSGIYFLKVLKGNGDGRTAKVLVVR